jgi:nicotinate-nucleotide adenylyltransferase
MVREGAATSVSRLGVFGGSFNPVHVGHMIAAACVQHTLDLDLIVFLPAGQPPHKSTRQLASAIDRVAMLQLSLDGAANFAISRIDVDRSGPSFTVDSLVEIRRAYPNAHSLYFLMGQDSLRDFPSWYRPQDIVQQARLAVVVRPGVQVDMHGLEREVPGLLGRVDLVEIPLIGISSSAIRSRVRNGRPIRYQVLPEVDDYIRERGLYRVDGVPAQTMEDSSSSR